VGDIDERDPELALEVREHRLHPDLEVRVERGQRLVEQQDFWLGHQRAGERDALALAARKVRDVALGELGNLHPLEPLVGTLPSLGLAHAAHSQAELDILTHRQEGEEREALPYHRRVAAPGRQVVDASAVQADFALARSVEAREHPERGGLTAAARAHDREELAFADLKIHGLDGDMVPVALGDTVEDDEWLGGHDRLSIH